MRRAYQSDDEIGMIPREMAQGLRDLVGRAMVDPDFLVALQRSPNALLADYELTADERATILQALARLARAPFSSPRPSGAASSRCSITCAPPTSSAR